MLTRQALILVFAASVLAGCGAGAVPGSGALSGAAMSGANLSSALRSHADVGPNSAPKIKKVSPIQASQYQTIVIKGKGFGKMQPYNGDSCCIEVSVMNTACSDYIWNAGYTNSSQYDAVWLNVTKWSNKKIVITGFTGAYGSNCWTLASGDPVTISVWNAQTQSGPATWSGTVQ